jgi:hypothetical protein
MFDLGVNGPYQRVNARLLYTDGSRTLFADARADAGTTAAYNLDSFRPSAHFTNQNSAAGVVTTGGPAYDLLRIQIGVYNSAVRNCTISPTFNDSKRRPNPLRQRIREESGWESAGTFSPWQTQSLTALQFVPAALISRCRLQALPSAAAGSIFRFPVSTSPLRGFEGSIDLSATELPAGASGIFASPPALGLSNTAFIVTTTAGVPPGTYPITVTATSGTITHSVPVSLIVTAP